MADLNYRETAEHLIARMAPSNNWVEEIAKKVTISIQRAIAAARDDGVARESIEEALPFILRATAINGLVAIGDADAIDGSLDLLAKSATGDDDEGSVTIIRARR